MGAGKLHPCNCVFRRFPGFRVTLGTSSEIFVWKKLFVDVLQQVDLFPHFRREADAVAAFIDHQLAEIVVQFAEAP